MEANTTLMYKGIKCLVDHFGIVEAEIIISTINRERFDYTEWQREYYDAKDPEEISREAVAFTKAHPYTGNAIRL